MTTKEAQERAADAATRVCKAMGDGCKGMLYELVERVVFRAIMDSRDAVPAKAQQATAPKECVSDTPCRECGSFSVVGDRCFVCEANDAA